MISFFFIVSESNSNHSALKYDHDEFFLFLFPKRKGDWSNIDVRGVANK